MFTEFFYVLKAKGLNISTKEWMTLMEGLELELHESTLLGFYRLCMGELEEIEVIPAIRTGPMLHEKFLVPRSEFCIHRSFTEVAYPFIKDYTKPYLDAYSGTDREW